MKASVEKQHVGIDISKDAFNVCFMVLTEERKVKIVGSRTFKNTSSGYKLFHTWVEKKRSKACGLSFSMEATGIYHENIAYYLHDLGYRVSILLAQQVKSYIKSLNVHSKTDKLDAKYIAQMGIERTLKSWQPLCANIRVLKQLTRERSSVQKEKTALQNKLHAYTHSHNPNKDAIKLVKQRIKLLEKQLPVMEQLIKSCVEQDAYLKERIEKICTIKGFSLVSVAVVVAETNGFQNFSSRAQLTSYAGYDIVERQSGSSIKGRTRISKRGNTQIRAILHFPALSAVKHEPVFTKLYDRIMERTEFKMKALVAVQRKLLLMAYTLFKKNEEFDPNFHKKVVGMEKKSRQGTMPAYTG